MEVKILPLCTGDSGGKDRLGKSFMQVLPVIQVWTQTDGTPTKQLSGEDYSGMALGKTQKSQSWLNLNMILSRGLQNTPQPTSCLLRTGWGWQEKTVSDNIRLASSHSLFLGEEKKGLGERHCQQYISKYINASHLSDRPVQCRARYKPIISVRGKTHTLPLQSYDLFSCLVSLLL